MLAPYDDGNADVEAVRMRVDRMAPQGSNDQELVTLRRFYEQRTFQPAWEGPRAARALDVLQRSGAHGLDPRLYQAQELAQRHAQLTATSPASDRAALDVDLTRALLRLAGDLEAGQIRPDARHAQNQPRRPRPDAVAVLERAAQGNPAEELEALAPVNAEYTNLRHALARLHGIAAAGGWGRLPPGPTLSEGASGARVLALRHRLTAGGEIPVEQASLPRFDAHLAEGVRRFQKAHGLEPTGNVDEATAAELNVPVENRIETVVLNLERWRWMPRTTPPRYLLVNIPAFELTLVQGPRSTLESRIVVGKAWSPTPVFSDEIVSVVLNPAWNVPQSITREEILPAVRRDPTYLARNQMRLYRGEEEVEPASVDWDSDMEGLSVRQDPGDLNALGKIKFLMPNKFDVYLHDTPAGHLFGREERAFSHGCIRVERPLDLATALLADQPDWPTSRIEEVIAAGKTAEVKLGQPVPVHITYFTAWTAPSGDVRFGPDVYGLDRELAAALKERKPDATIAGGLLRSQQDPNHSVSTGGSTPWL
jgi:murein L,D-transpeptidase YcbB/YkuD